MQAKWIAVYVLAMILGTCFLGMKALNSLDKVKKIERTPQTYTQGENPMLNEYVLAAHLAMSPVASNPQLTQQDAWRYVGKAAYIELGVGSFVKQIEKKLIPEDIRPYVSYTGTILRLVNDKQITYTWSF